MKSATQGLKRSTILISQATAAKIPQTKNIIFQVLYRRKIRALNYEASNPKQTQTQANLIETLVKSIYLSTNQIAIQ